MEFDQIPVDKIEIGKSQARIRKVKEDLQELVESIKKMGLLQPVTVYKKNGKYELVTGQRRFLAVQQLGWRTIPAQIVDPPKSELEIKVRSLTENIVRTDMVDQDTIDAVTEAYRHYGSIKAVSEETGLSEGKVRQYVKFERLPKTVQKAVKEGMVSLPNALKAADALTWDSGVREEESKVMELAEEMEKLSPSERNEATKVAQADPGKPVDEIVEKAKKPKNIKEIHVKLFSEDYDKLSTYSESEQLGSPEEAAADLVVEGLKSKGY